MAVAARSSWTKDEFAQHANCEITDEFWSEWGPILQKITEDEPLFCNVVRVAQKAQKLEKLEIENKKLQTAAKGKPYSYLVLSVSNASKDEGLRKLFRNTQVGESVCRGGFVAHKFYLDFVLASREFSGFSSVEEEKQETIKAVRRLGSVLNRRAQHSMFCDDHIDAQGPQSAVASELFQLAINMMEKDDSLHRLRVTHQQHVVARSATGEFRHITKKRSASGDGKVSGGNDDGKKTDDRIDVCIWFVHEEESLGSCVAAACEYKPNNMQATARIAQADMYGNNIFLLHKKPCVIIDIVGGNDVSNWVVSAHGLVEANFTPEEVSFEKSLLYTGKGAEAIVLVAWGLLKAKPSFPRELDDFGDRLGPNVGLIDGHVYKVYDGAQTRRPNIDVVRRITEDTTVELLESKDKKLKIMKMKELTSNWKTPTNAQSAFGSIIEKLHTLHKEYGPHGDIRLANLLSSGHVIDFDFVRGESYPLTLNLIDKDGCRHEDVVNMIKANETEPTPTLLKMENSHDWFSLGKVMELFQPVEESNTDDWEKVCDLVLEGKAADAVERGFNYEIQLKDGNSIPLRGTGNTPEKKPISKTKRARSTASSEHA